MTLSVRRQGVYFGATIKYENDMDMELLFEIHKEDINYMKGQQEIGEQDGYHHWQVVFVMKKKKSVLQMKEYHPTAHFWLTDSKKALDYVEKERTKVPSTEFEFGKLPFKRNSKTDWGQVMLLAKNGEFDEIPDNVLVRHWTGLHKINMYYDEPVFRPDIEVLYWWGEPGTGKSWQARELYPNAYRKVSTTKWWDNYKGQKEVIIDDLVPNCINIGKLLNWLDKYECLIEIKGGNLALKADKFVITSNLPPEELLRESNVHPIHIRAFMRRIKVRQFLIRYNE